jgi:predicted transcriptional regulator
MMEILSREAAAELRAKILARLARGVCTTEEIRVECRETYNVVWQQLRRLAMEGKIQGSSRKRGEQRKWRLTPEKPNARTATTARSA